MTIPRIIGITGYAQNGKDTVAEVLVRELGYSRVALADQMKRALYALNPLVDAGDNWRPGIVHLQTLVDQDGWDAAKALPDVRGLLQRLGTQVGRKLLGEDTWIGALVNDTAGIYGNERRIVIPDIRFQNEADWVRRLHGEVWAVTRPDFDSGVSREHESERNVGPLIHGAELTFVNTGTRHAFQERVYRVLQNRVALVKT